ncbi:marine proteobacterial sortase target protein [endosymbiont of Lamellibrachia barhami]|uniref:marine proteobacterial sortase target protein n=1 Tax=endosymbiont of Lamellibrachia barhami TaxID=205975 RepID=UPI0015ABB79A|nr:marine proteobacterial sortase target protein [endosymbiont of Lamellibrachia barhami]
MSHSLMQAGDNVDGPVRIDLRNREFVKDMLLTLIAAIGAGLAGSVFFILLVLSTSGSALAAAEEVTRGTLNLYSLDGRRIDDAPNLSTDVEMQINGMLARVKVAQHFSNSSQDWVEGIYQFPLPEDAAVDRLWMRIGERVIEGEIQEKEQARATYEKAKSEGRKASLLSQQRPNMFTASVANIGPGESILIEIEYQQSLGYDQGRFQIRFPLVIAPRYIPGIPIVPEESSGFSGTGWAADTDQAPDASRITPSVADPALGPINPVAIAIQLDAGLPLASLESRYHPIVHTQDDRGRYQIGLKSKQVPADRDFELTWVPKVGVAPHAALFTELWENETYGLLMVMPPQGDAVIPTQPREVIFVVDTSGSMHGTSIAQAKAALKIALRRLRPEDRFNIIQFSSYTRALHQHAVDATPRNLRQALDYVSSLRADGGTEMLPALELALDGREFHDRLRQVIFLTDGSVGNEDELFKVIRRRLGASRLFTIGIGSAPNSFFMSRAAEFGRGSFTYVGDLEEVESRLAALFLKLEQPLLTNIQLQWPDGAEVEGYPNPLPDLYAGEPILLALKADQLQGQLTIKGDRAGESWQRRIPLRGGGDQTGVHLLWARANIAELMAQRNRGRPEPDVRKAVLEVALKHRLVSRYTSLIAVDKTPTRQLEEMLKTKPMPTNLPHGWTANKVFGRMPQTATPASLHLLIGLLLLLSVFVLTGRRRT